MIRTPRPGAAAPEQGVGVFGQQPLPLGEIDDSYLRRRGCQAATRDTAVQHFENRVDRGQHVRLGSPERGQPQRRQPELQRTEVVATQGQVMQEVPGTVAVVGMHRIERRARRGRVGDHFRANGRELPQDRFDFGALGARGVAGLSRRSTPCDS